MTKLCGFQYIELMLEGEQCSRYLVQLYISWLACTENKSKFTELQTFNFGQNARLFNGSTYADTYR